MRKHLIKDYNFHSVHYCRIMGGKGMGFVVNLYWIVDTRSVRLDFGEGKSKGEYLKEVRYGRILSIIHKNNFHG